MCLERYCLNILLEISLKWLRQRILVSIVHFHVFNKSFLLTEDLYIHCHKLMDILCRSYFFFTSKLRKESTLFTDPHVFRQNYHGRWRCSLYELVLTVSVLDSAVVIYSYNGQRTFLSTHYWLFLYFVDTHWTFSPIINNDYFAFFVWLKIWTL